jgi:hypothetical protein
VETNWQNITRRLDINQASRDSTYDKTRGHGRTIKKVPWAFTIPAFTYNVNANSIPEGCLLAQYNYTAPKAFRLLRAVIQTPQSAAPQVPLVCIKWRVGDIVHRYMLPYVYSSFNIVEQHNRKVQAPLYDEQRIPANFCIEFWTHYLIYQIPFFARIVTIEDSSMTTNLLELPDDADETEETFDIAEILPRADLVSTFDEALPTVTVSNSSWLTN